MDTSNNIDNDIKFLAKSEIRLKILNELDKHPDIHDHLYFSENLFHGLSEGLFAYQFSAEIGWPCARQPHDFLLDPKEFLILEYSDGTTLLLEEVYG